MEHKRDQTLNTITSVPPLLLFFLFLSCFHSHVALSSFQAVGTTRSLISPMRSNSSDQMALLVSFKSSLTSDPLDALISWNETLHMCQWRGVVCSRRHPGRVTGLILRSLRLSGPIPTSLANLTFLGRLDLGNNSFYGHLPGELGRLSRLRGLNLSRNSLEGGIPASLGRCTNLRSIDLAYNMLTGNVPTFLSNLSSLRSLGLGPNRLQGHIPLGLGNITSLTELCLSGNSLVGTIPPTIGDLLSLQGLYLYDSNLEGNIPPELGSLQRLQVLALNNNKLSGAFPSSLCNLSSLVGVDVGANQLSGTLPPHIGSSLRNLQFLSAWDNQFHGPIPPSIPNASALSVIQLNNNSFSGVVPSKLGNLKGLTNLLLHRNQLQARDDEDWSFLCSLANCTYLNRVSLVNNDFGGVLPRAISNLSTDLSVLGLNGNHISGNVPEGIGGLLGLTALGLGDNILEGVIPITIGMLQNLNRLDLSFNRFSGEIPSSISNLTQLTEIYITGNELQGPIPPSLGNLQKLLYLDLSRNNLSGVIPNELVSISSLSISLNLSSNSLSGVLPPEVGHLTNLNKMDVSGNRLSGEIPTTLGNCEVLEYLYVHDNAFQGVIPQSLIQLGGLAELDLSHNNLTGKIPKFLQNFRSLKYLNLSFNNFDGEVPEGGIFRNASAVFVLGNHNLCGGIPELQLPATCPPGEFRGHHRRTQLTSIITGVSVALCLLLLVLYFTFSYYSRRKDSPATVTANELLGRITYSQIFEATEGFSSQSLIGVGSFGSVYKANMDPSDPRGQLVAVKVINLRQKGASKSFVAECEALRNIRHRNLLKIVTTCSSIDFSGSDFKALVFDFMPNGSLEEWLHPAESENCEKHLSLVQRLNIAVDVASALAYLHHHSRDPIVHCDLKPSNVLLDNDMTAHVSDFGLARFLIKDDCKDPTSSLALRGSIGYVAPEYGMGCKASIEGDVFSYGVLLLEMITGKRPTNASFVEDLTLHKFVEMSFPKNVLDIVDQTLLTENDGNAYNTLESRDNVCQRRQTCLISMARLGLICSQEPPKERMGMEATQKEVTTIRDVFLGVGFH